MVLLLWLFVFIVVYNPHGLFDESKIVLYHLSPVLDVSNFLQLAASTVSHATPLLCGFGKLVRAVAESLALVV